MESRLVGTAKLVGLGCAGSSALYWASFAQAKLGNYLVYAGLRHTDAIGVPVNPSTAAGTPLVGVVAFWAVMTVGLAAWATMAALVVVRLRARRGRR